MRYLLEGKLHFDYTESDISEAALQKLLSIFSKTNSNKELISKLRSLIKQRDEIAHKAFVVLYGSTNKVNAELEKLSEEYIQIAVQLGEILGDINDASLKLYLIRNPRAIKK